MITQQHSNCCGITIVAEHRPEFTEFIPVRPVPFVVLTTTAGSTDLAQALLRRLAPGHHSRIVETLDPRLSYILISNAHDREPEHNPDLNETDRRFQAALHAVSMVVGGISVVSLYSIQLASRANSTTLDTSQLVGAVARGDLMEITLAGTQIEVMPMLVSTGWTRVLSFVNGNSSNKVSIFNKIKE